MMLRFSFFNYASLFFNDLKRQNKMLVCTFAVVKPKLCFIQKSSKKLGIFRVQTQSNKHYPTIKYLLQFIPPLNACYICPEQAIHVVYKKRNNRQKKTFVFPQGSRLILPPFRVGKLGLFLACSMLAADLTYPPLTSQPDV